MFCTSMYFILRTYQFIYNKLIRKVILFIILFTLSLNSFTQSNNESLVHLLKFRTSERINNSAIPLIQTCISNKDSIVDCVYPDFDGISLLVITSENYNFDSISIKDESKILEGNSKKLTLLLKDIELNKEINFDEKKIILIRHDIMTDEEYKKHIILIEKLPG